MDSEDDDQQKEVVSLETWRQKTDVVYSCRCKEIRSNGHSFSRYEHYIHVLLECAMAQLVSVSVSSANSKVRSSNPAGNNKSFSIG